MLWSFFSGTFCPHLICWRERKKALRFCVPASPPAWSRFCLGWGGMLVCPGASVLRGSRGGWCICRQAWFSVCTQTSLTSLFMTLPHILAEHHRTSHAKHIQSKTRHSAKLPFPLSPLIEESVPTVSFFFYDGFRFIIQQHPCSRGNNLFSLILSMGPRKGCSLLYIPMGSFQASINNPPQGSLLHNPVHLGVWGLLDSADIFPSLHNFFPSPCPLPPLYPRQYLNGLLTLLRAYTFRYQILLGLCLSQ